jgi:hypothetical protein
MTQSEERAVLEVLADSFWKRVDVCSKDECWPWLASTNQGYGRFFYPSKKSMRAHVFAYKLLVGPIPDGLRLDHLCRNRLCVNPNHLEPVTHKENVLRGVGITAKNAQKTHCERGHPLSGTNLLLREQGAYGGIHRQCRTCISLHEKQRRIARKNNEQRT